MLRIKKMEEQRFGCYDKYLGCVEHMKALEPYDVPHKLPVQLKRSFFGYTNLFTSSHCGQ
jgi:hypothetical protein